MSSADDSSEANRAVGVAVLGRKAFGAPDDEKGAKAVHAPGARRTAARESVEIFILEGCFAGKRGRE